MKTKFKDKQNIIFRIALAAALVFVAVSALQTKNDLDTDYEALADLEIRCHNQQRVNDELAAQNADSGSYLYQLLEQAAHNKGYYRPGELVFKEVPGH
ncbi:MAG: hypothetical protein IJB27_04875 [Clostridia bacterium]|nr:hypothetical protein [Clostridia bacterium]